VAETPIQAQYVTIARVFRSRGNRGEVVAEDLSDDPLRRFTPGARFFLAGSGPQREILLEEAWQHKGRLILKFEGIGSISEAEALRGCEVQIPEAELGPAPEGGHFVQDLVGCRLLDADSGRELGVVRNVLEMPGTPVLEVDAAGREILVPFVQSICVEIAPAERTIRVRLPEGLEELNP
jgi:16S rRNA processing protein RimM